MPEALDVVVRAGPHASFMGLIGLEDLATGVESGFLLIEVLYL